MERVIREGLAPRNVVEGHELPGEKRTKQIVVKPYNPEWPKSFEREATTIEQSLGANCVIMKCTHHAEWEVAKHLRQRVFFDPLSLSDPYTWTFNHPEHAHLVLYQGVDIIGYAHMQFWPNHRAALRIFVINENHRRHGLGSQFLYLCEQWLKKAGVKSLHDEARPDSVDFYRKNGYVEMPFDDPSGDHPSPYDIAMGKRFITPVL